MTPFEFEHVFKAPSVADVFAVYVDRGHTADQDAQVEIAQRDFLEYENTDTHFRRVCRVVPRRQLPAFVRPFLSGGLEFHETATWDKSTNVILIEVKPSILGGRATVSSKYELTPGGPGEVVRRYHGSVTVEVKLVGGRIERAIVEDIGSSLPTSAACTQRWLDRRAAGG